MSAPGLLADALAPLVLLVAGAAALWFASAFGRALARRRRWVEEAVVVCLADGPRFSHALAQDLEETLGVEPPTVVVEDAADRLRLSGLLVWGEPGFAAPDGPRAVAAPVRRIYRLTAAGDRRARHLLDGPRAGKAGPLGRPERAGGARPTGWGS